MRPAIDCLANKLRASGWADRLEAQVSLAPHTTFRIGGAADLAVEARTGAELEALWWMAHDCDVPCLVLGRGSNVLVSDRGVRGLVVFNRCTSWEISPTGALSSASGAPLTEVARRSAEAGWAGIEWAAGIPGSVGGAVVGNAGAHGGYVGDVLVSVTVLDHGVVRTLPRDELGLGYRTSCFKAVPTCNGRPLILEATFGLRPGDAGALEARIAELLQWRADRHPQEPSAGSIFRRTAQYPAGFLIEQAGLKGRRIGGAEVSPKHANFIVNAGGAMASDVKALIDEIQEAVAARFGVTLELEIELVGEW